MRPKKKILTKAKIARQTVGTKKHRGPVGRWSKKAQHAAKKHPASDILFI